MAIHMPAPIVEDRNAVRLGERRPVDAPLKPPIQSDYEDVCATLLDVIGTTFGARVSWVLLHERRSNCLVTGACRGPGSHAYADVQIPSDVGIMGLAFSTGEPVFVPDVGTDHRWFHPDLVDNSGLPSVLAVPLFHGNQRVGVIAFHSERFGPHAFPTPADRELLRAIGALATLALMKARLADNLENERMRRARETLQRRGPMTEVHHLRREVRECGAFGTMVGKSRPFLGVIEQGELIASTDTTVLLFGETGTGKELVARAIHARSRRAQGVFVAVNCAALPSTLIESELFGHEKGAFTGALDRKPGKFELADGGTIFLDEIGDMPLEAQAKLLRALQEREVTRVGGTKTISVNTRVIAATNQDLLSRARTNLFRADLYYRLSVFPISLPPLRERREDIPLLVGHFVERFAARVHTAIPDIDGDAMDRLVSYDWPGNVRELQNVVERVVILARGKPIGAEMIASATTGSARPSRNTVTITEPASGKDPGGASTQPAAAHPRAEPDPVYPLAEAERLAILQALQVAGWRISGKGGAAEVLGLKPTTLHAKMKKLGVRRPHSISEVR